MPGLQKNPWLLTTLAFSTITTSIPWSNESMYVRRLFVGIGNRDSRASGEDSPQKKPILKLKDDCLIAVIDRFDQVRKQ